MTDAGYDGSPMQLCQWTSLGQRLCSIAGAVATWFLKEFTGKTIGGIDADVFEHFFYSLCTRAGITAHILFMGRNDHHKCEAVFKAFGIALGEASKIVAGRDDIPSTKGIL